MVFGTLEEIPYDERIRIALNEFKEYHKLIGESDKKIVLSWRDAQVGDWCFSDDLRIVEILVRNNTPPRTDTTASFNKGYIRTCVGTFPINPNTFMDTDFAEHPNRYSISQRAKSVDERVRARTYLTLREDMFCSFVAKGMDKVKAYKQSFITKDTMYAHDSSTRLLQQERIQSAISEEVEEILTREGVSKSYIIQRYKQLIDDGLLDMKNCAPSVRSALRDLSEISNMFPDKKKITESVKGVLQGVPNDRLNQIIGKRYELTNEKLELTAPQSNEVEIEYVEERESNDSRTNDEYIREHSELEQNVLDNEFNELLQ